MPKKTCLEIVQSVLNDINGDEVNSIDDTEESAQVAVILKDTYDAMMSNRDWEHTKQLIQLIASGTTDRPTHMTYNAAVKSIDFINYDKAKQGDTRKRYEDVKWKEPDNFLRMVNNRDDTDSTIKVVTDPTGVLLMIRNDVAPSYYTTFDDEHIVFDSYDSAVDDTLIAAKVQSMGYVMPSLVVTDTAVPDLPIDAFAYLVEEVKSRASYKLKQQQDPKSEAESTLQRRWLSRNQWTVHGGLRRINYGRSRGRTRDSTFQKDR